jgi:hypothetical protein
MPQVSEWMQRLGGSPTQFASETSNICMYTSPTSRRTHGLASGYAETQLPWRDLERDRRLVRT